MYVLLRRRVSPNPDPTPGAAPFLATVETWDTEQRTYYAYQEDSQLNDPSERAVDFEVTRYEVRPGTTRVIKCAGGGRVKATNAPASGTTPTVCNLAANAQPTATYTSSASFADACIDATGTLGTPPYALTLAGPASRTGVSPSSYYPVRFYDLPTGTYTLTVADAAGCQATQRIEVQPGPGTTGRGATLRNDYDGDPQTGNGTEVRWIFNSRTVETYSYTGGGSGDPSGDHTQTPYGEQVDGYLLDDGVTWRKVFSDGAVNGIPGVYFEDSTTAKAGTLTLHNLILFNPDSVAEQNGGAIVEVNATSFPVTYVLRKGTITLQTNTSGYFDSLAAGSYTVTATDAGGNSLPVPFDLVAEYQPRWQLVFDDIDSVPLRLELWLRGYTGSVEDVCGQEEPVTLKSDGLNGTLGGQGDVPSVVGSSAELALLVEPGTFEQLLLGDDRLCRCDVYRAGALVFRGYVQPDIADEPLQDGKQPVSLTATDGLAGLKDTYFTGHIGQRLIGYRPILNTLLHCLSRTGISLPVRAYVNRRDATMPDDGAPELLASTNRTGYWDDSEKNEPILARTVVDALAQALGGTLCQRAGRWEIRSALEAAFDAPGRAYKPAGTPLPAVTAVAPNATIVPSTLGYPHWVQASQHKQVRPGWKSLVGSTDVGYLKNALPAGNVFSDRYAWLGDGTLLKPVYGWKPAPGQTFPLILVRGGEKGTDYTTRWVRSASFSERSEQALDSPPLPVVAPPESIPAYLVFSGKLVATTYLQAGDRPAVAGTAKKAILAYDLLVDGAATGIKTVEIELAKGPTAKDSELTVALPNLATGVKEVVLRVYAWYAPQSNLVLLSQDFQFGEAIAIGDVRRIRFNGGSYRVFQSKVAYGANGGGTGIAPNAAGTDVYWQELLATDIAQGQLLISSIGVQLRPQNATWEGEDNFRVDGPGGTVRPTEVYESYHADVPLQAGFFAGNILAFGKTVALSDATQSTSWARAVDKLPAPLFEANVLDALALRAGPSRLLLGTLRFGPATVLYLLDSVDAPYDLNPDRRFWLAASDWRLKANEAEVSGIEIGAGAAVPDPAGALPDGARVTHRLVPYLPGVYTRQARVTHDGRIRVRHL